ncbi:MAG: ATP-binding cassette domain-containing protein [Clostridia bacterium]|nr:ATP-binding cassette domain-containing protein [Clostridia bacterium]MBQ9737736.1 ATP-binding cassette domain-containing protein [Clostridia bacterium]
MEIYTLKNLSFAYPNREEEALKNINLSVKMGEFVLLCGKSGCGKTTLLRLLKSSLSPFGNLTGEILYNNQPLAETQPRVQASEIGFVLQNPDNQIATDKVWHEMAFGLESLGMKTAEIRTKVSEMASFFGIQNWFYKKTSELSGGEKQLLNLASIMVMQPEVLILDEPTSQLDPIAASEFLNTLKKINDELGTTIILTEHRLEEAFAISDRVIVMDSGEVIADDTPKNIGRILIERSHDMCDALPVPMRVFGSLGDCSSLPLTIREGKSQLLEYSKTHHLDNSLIAKDKEPINNKPVIEVKDAYFRYDKNLPDVVKGLNLTVCQGEFFAILGGNGTGKTTAISLVSGLNAPQRGEVYINGCEISKHSDLYNGILGVLPQSPQSLFAKKTVYLDLFDMTDKRLSKEEREKRVFEIASLCRIENLLEFHPYDLSGGEQQRTALAMVLLKAPQILILDEPTKGMDAHFKRNFSDILESLKKSGVTILMVSHDIEFCAEYADRCGMFFDGAITSVEAPREFFCGNSFYTTSANRMARKLLPDAVLAEDIILASGGMSKPKPKKKDYIYTIPEKPKNEEKKQKLTLKRVVSGVFFALCFIITLCLQETPTAASVGVGYVLQVVSILFAVLGLFCLIPQTEIKTAQIQIPEFDRKLAKRTLVAALLILVAIPLTIYLGIYYLGDRKYYFVSLLIILETMLPFCMVFEKRKPQAREIVIISVLCAISVAGRTAFFMLPQFKPVVAIVIIAGICFGGETGFLVGSMTGFVSNFVFGQGPWTPWQMFAFGIIGFASGVLFKKGFLLKTRVSLAVFGFLMTLMVYGGIMNTASVLMITNAPNWAMLKTAYIMGLPVDLIHALSSAFFLWFISGPMIEKLERIKVKYGLIER